MDALSSIVAAFNDRFGNIEWKDPDNVYRQILALPDMVSKYDTYQNAMRNSDKQNARLESDRALSRIIINIMTDNMELFKQFQDDQSFRQWLADFVFSQTYEEGKRDAGN